MIDTWERSLRAEYLDAANNDFSRALKARINRLLLGDAAILIAVRPDDSNYIIGWLCHEGQTVHYVYVRANYRNTNIARRLLGRVGIAGNPLTCTAITKPARLISTKHRLRYLPPL